MPLTKKGDKILRKMRKYYGKKRGASVFYASVHKGRVLGSHRKNNWHEKLAQSKRRRYGKRVFRNKYARGSSKLSRRHRENISKGLKAYHKTGRRNAR